MAVKTDIDELREWITNVCVLVGNANRRGGADESLLTALNIMRARAIERGCVVPGINWSAYELPPGGTEGQVVVAATGEVRDASAIELGKITEAQVLRDVQAVVHENVAGNPVVAPEKLAEWLGVFLATSRTIDAERLAEMRRLTVDLAEAQRYAPRSESESHQRRVDVLQAAGVEVVDIGAEEWEEVEPASSHPNEHPSGWCDECICYHN